LGSGTSHPEDKNAAAYISGFLESPKVCHRGDARCLRESSRRLADQASDVAALEAKCEAEREAKIKPLRDAEIAKCKADQNNDPAYCERFWKDYGNSVRTANGGTVPRMFGDLPICVAAFKARKALADGDVQ
jgi:hypothetical protein